MHTHSLYSIFLSNILFQTRLSVPLFCETFDQLKDDAPLWTLLRIKLSLSVSLSLSLSLSLPLCLSFSLSLILSHSLSRPSPLQSEPAVRFRLLVGLLRHGALFYDVCLCHFFMFVLMCSCLQPLGCEVCLLFWQSLPGRETRS